MDIVTKYPAMTRRDDLQQWAIGGGKIWSTGARRPRGGRSGDTYDLYVQHNVKTAEGIHALFCHARVNFTLFLMLCNN